MRLEEDGARETLRDWGLLALRITLGVIFLAHGGQKLFGWFDGHGFTGTVQVFEAKLGIPPALGAAAILTEFFGGLAVLLGVFSRTAALGLAVVMVVAALQVHLPNGFFLATAPGQSNGVEYNVALFGMGLALALTGPGRFTMAGDTEWRLPELFRKAGRRRAAA